MTVKLYLPRTGHKHFDKMIEIHHWIEKQFGKPDYHTNYDLGFGDDSDDWCLYTFYDHTMAFWTYERYKEYILTAEQWREIKDKEFWGG